MNRTFKGFLQQYCAELSGLHTTSLHRLCDAAASNARLVEPLFLYAVEKDMVDYLVRLSEGKWFHDDYVELAKAAAPFESTQSFLESGNAPERYAAVLEAFKAQSDLLSAQRRMNGLLREKINAALELSGKTRYWLCKELKLNAGNAYAYLAGDDTKVSGETARRMFDYVTEQ